MITEVQAKNAEEARNKFLASLKGLRFIKGANDEDGSVSCYYNAADNLQAAAKTAPVSPD